mmetsp:Transcript_5096/g.14195  ORF Transcript_5096/g.14195 Transcript_5096/m.14195 type:complete len:214 (+) Transcript_5096:663-1304(+)
MTIQVLDGLDGHRLAIEFDLVALNGLLDCRTNVREARVDACESQSRVRPILGRLNDRIKLGIEGNRKGAIDNSPAHLHTEVELTDIVLRQNGVVSIIRSVVRCDPVERTTCWKSPTALKSVGCNKFVRLLFQALTDVDHGHTWASVGLHIMPHLTMTFGGAANFLVVVSVEAFEFSLLCGRSSVRMISNIFLNLADGKLVGWELLTNWNIKIG